MNETIIQGMSPTIKFKPTFKGVRVVVKVISFFLILNHRVFQVSGFFLPSSSSSIYDCKHLRPGSTIIPPHPTFRSASPVVLSSTTQNSGNRNSKSKRGRREPKSNDGANSGHGSITQRNKNKQSKLKTKKKNGKHPKQRHTKDELNDLVRSKFVSRTKKCLSLFA